MTDQIDFAQGNDTGESDSDAISPTVTGEPANRAAWNRPDETFRLRTEVLREEAANRRWIDDLDRHYDLYLDGVNGVTWGGVVTGGGTGVLTLGASTTLRVLPFMTPGVARGRSRENVGSLYPGILPVRTVTDGTTTITILSRLEVWEGGNEISFQVQDVASAPINVEVTGTAVSDPSATPGRDNIVVTFDSGAGHTIAAVLTAINADPVASALVDVTAVGTPADPMFAVASAKLGAGLDAIYHDITSTELAAFFAAAAENSLREGDTLGIWYDTALLRRSSTPESGNSVIPSGSLVNLTREPEKARGCVLIGKVIDDTFVFVNGIVCTKSQTITSFSPDNALRGDVNRPIAGPAAAGTNTYGSEIVGVDTSGFLRIAPADAQLQTTLNALDSAAFGANALIIGVASIQDQKAGANPTTSDVLLGDTFVPDDAPMFLASLATQAELPAFRNLGIGGALESKVYTTNVQTEILEATGRYLYGYDPTAGLLRAFDLVDEVSISPNVLISNGVDMSASPHAVAVIEDSTNTVSVIPPGGSNVDIVTAGVGSTGAGNGTPLRVAVRDDGFVYVLYVEDVGGTFDWIVDKFNYDPVGGTLVVQAASRFTLFSGLAAATDHAITGFETDGYQMVVTSTLASSGVDSLNVADRNLDTDAWGAVSSYSVDDGGGATTVTELVLTPSHILLCGTNLYGLSGETGPFDMVSYSRRAPFVAVAGASAADFFNMPAGAFYSKMTSDGKYIYATVTSTFNSTLDVLDMNLVRQHQLRPAGVGPVLVDIAADSQFVFTLEASAGHVYRTLSDPGPMAVRLAEKGAAPAWTNTTRV